MTLSQRRVSGPPAGTPSWSWTTRRPSGGWRVRMLTWTGYQAIEARHGREALATIEQHAGPVHLVLTDIKMPGMNGRELGRYVEERWPGKPILYMSGFASEVFQGGLLEPGRALPGQAVHPGGPGPKGPEPAEERLRRHAVMPPAHQLSVPAVTGSIRRPESAYGARADAYTCLVTGCPVPGQHPAQGCNECCRCRQMPGGSV